MTATANKDAIETAVILAREYPDLTRRDLDRLLSIATDRQAAAKRIIANRPDLAEVVASTLDEIERDEHEMGLADAARNLRDHIDAAYDHSHFGL